MEILLFSQYDIQRPLTNAIADVRLCEGLSEAGAEVKLIVPEVDRDDNIEKEKIFKIFDIRTAFDIHYLKPSFSANKLNKFHAIKIIKKTTSFFFKEVIKIEDQLFIISRNTYILFPMIIIRNLLRLKNIKIVPWLHEISVGMHHDYVYKNSDFYLTTNSAIKEDLRKKYGPPESRIELTLNPVSQHQFINRISKEMARKEIGYTSDKPLIVYTGKLFIGQKEIQHIIKAASELPDYNFLFTGGKPEVIDHYRSFCKSNGIINCNFTGYIYDYSRVKLYQAAADILISYYTENEHSVNHNLPSKICEYMMTGNPIITPRYPALLDLLNDTNCYFIEPSNSKHIVSGIQILIKDNILAKKLGDKALKDIQSVTSEKIGLKVVKALNSVHN